MAQDTPEAVAISEQMIDATSDDDWRANVEEWALSSTSIMLVAEDGNRWIGSANCHESGRQSERIATLWAFWVREGYRNQGTGSLLLQRAEEWAKDAGFEAVDPWVHGSSRAVGFYIRNGFVDTGRRASQSRGGEKNLIQMQKQLALVVVDKWLFLVW